jgi:hypothetical protein
MKRILTLLTLVSILTYTLISCNKDSTSNNSNTTANDSIYLDKVYNLSYSGSGLDTQYIYTCNYDNAHRLTSLISTPVANNVNGYFYYNGNDTLPFKSEYIDEHVGIDTGTVYHFYDANQVKTKDSMITSLQSGSSYYTEVVNYTYSPGEMFGEIILTTASATIYLRDTAILDANGNIINSKDYVFDGTGYVLNRTSDFTYDSNINPFSKLNIFKSMRRFPNGETLFYEIMCYNNIITQSETTVAPNPSNYTQVFSYTYNQNGLPAISSTGVVPNFEQQIFTYKPL